MEKIALLLLVPLLAFSTDGELVTGRGDLDVFGIYPWQIGAHNEFAVIHVGFKRRSTALRWATQPAAKEAIKQIIEIPPKAVQFAKR